MSIVLEFGGKSRDPDIRYLYDMKDVLYDQKWAKNAENVELYYMYRDLYLSRKDRDLLMEQGLRYDITIIPPGMLGLEYVKTAGHYHPDVPGCDTTYPEVYEVLEGEAVYLLQSLDSSDVVAINAVAGDKVLIPPGYGHITINRSNKKLKMANFVCRDFSSIYEPIKRMRGGSYYLTSDGFVKNEHYPQASPLREIVVPDAKDLGLVRGREMYPLLRDKGKLDYLVHPQDHMEVFEGRLV
ncbi:MAG: glucose-6-phosphate isomerase family protein [Methanotrichaceae archaeon]